MCLLRCFFVFHLVTLCGVQTFHSSAFVCVCVASPSTAQFSSWQHGYFSQVSNKGPPFFVYYPALPDPSHCLCFWVLFPPSSVNGQLWLSPAFYVSLTHSLTLSSVLLLFLITDTTVSSQKGKTAFNQSRLDYRIFSDGFHVLVLLLCAFRIFANEMKNISCFLLMLI